MCAAARRCVEGSCPLIGCDVMDGCLIIHPMDSVCASEIMQWAYDGPYSRYNLGSGDMDELLNGSYFAAFDHLDKLIGFFCFGMAAQVPAGNRLGHYYEDSLLDIGLGMAPPLCGQGRGLAFLREGMEWAYHKFRPKGFRLTVASFNHRAILVYERAGFEKASLFECDTGGQVTEFWVMRCQEYNQKDQHTGSSTSYTVAPTNPGPP